ncbi:uncharacterized protein LOC107862423 [Capsicum annuum]|uniref:uncharacterized protein LOC107862423 n=1 Tax=Capsicum annuum TaxID=4072 RepID=UPI001FB051D3|nr:uncharacterized protein LOC107862423 [Capsicum annuum]
MGNCQAIDNATLLIQHPSGRVDKLYWPVTANEIMKMNPGHYVALLLTTTTLCTPTNPATTTTAISTVTPTARKDTNTTATNTATTGNIPVRITRIKLLKPTDTLVLGHVYRLITTQEVMKGLWAKKYSKMKQQQLESGEKTEKSTNSHGLVRRSELDYSKQVKQEKHRSSTGAKPRTWHPKLHSISEATN